MGRYNQDRNPEFRKITFNGHAGVWDAAMESGAIVDLPANDAQHRPLRGRIVEIADMGGQIVAVTAELEVQ